MSIDLVEYFCGLNEAAGDKAEASEPIDSSKDDSNKDIEADKADSTKDSDDVAADAEDADANSDETEPTDGDDSSSGEDTSTVADDSGNDTSTDALEPEESSKDKEKKLLLYRSLRDLRSSFNNTADIYDTILSTDIPESNIPTIKVIRKKIGNNIELLDELLSDTSIATTKTYADLQAIHNIYLNDLTTIDKNLKALYKLIATKK